MNLLQLVVKIAAASFKQPTDVDAGGAKGLEDSVIGVVNAVILVLGIVAVIVMVYGGVTYMTSAGDTSKVKKGKDIILYGVIGLIICSLAAAIVNFVIANVTSASNCSEGEEWSAEEKKCVKKED